MYLPILCTVDGLCFVSHFLPRCFKKQAQVWAFGKGQRDDRHSPVSPVIGQPWTDRHIEK